MNELLSIVLTIITAATPLLLASIGELVVERSGVLNLGVEGMMAVGAVCGFGAALMTGSPLVGVLAAIAAGVILSMLFGFLTLTMVSNQVATGLALTLLGLGLAGMIGEGFVGQPGVKLEKISIPGLTGIPFIGPVLFGQDLLVYVSLIIVAATSYVLFRTKTGLIIRAVGDSHQSAHALGYSVIGVRYLCVMFGSGWRLPFTGLHAAMGGEHDRRARLDRVGLGGVRLLAAVAACDRRLSLRYHYNSRILAAGCWNRHSVAAIVLAALRRDHSCAGRDFGQPGSDTGQYTGLPRSALRA